MLRKLYFSHYSPPARAVYLVAKALNLNLELKDTDILSKKYLTPDLLKINPMHTIPTLQDGDFVIWDSHAIAGYLASQYGKGNNESLYPRDPKLRATIDQRLYFDAEMLFPKAHEAVVPIIFQGKTSIDPDLVAGIKNSYSVLELFLAKTPWLAGNRLSIADLCCLPSITTLEYIVPMSGKRHPKLTAYLERCRELPYYEEANQTGVDMLGHMIQERLILTKVKHWRQNLRKLKNL